MVDLLINYGDIHCDESTSIQTLKYILAMDKEFEPI